MSESKKVIIDFLKSQLFKKEFYSQCEVDRVLDAMGRRSSLRGNPSYEVISAMHLVNWVDMTPDVVAAVKQTVFDFIKD